MADAPESTPKIDALRAKFEADPKSRHFYPLAEELRKISQLEEAEKVLRTGLEHHASYLSAWISLGRVLKERQAYPEAVDVLMRALSLDPENVVAAKLLANVYLGMGEKVEAIKKFKLVNALMPADEDAEEQIAALERELNPPQDQPAPPPPVPPPPPASEADTPHDSTEPPFQLDEAPEIPTVAEPSSSAADQASPSGASANFDLTNPDPFALGDQGPADEPAAAPEPELADEASPFAGAELPGSPEAAVEPEHVKEEDPFASVPGPDIAAAPQRAPSSEDVWAEEEASGDLPESAATVTMAQILAQQGDTDRAKATYAKVLEREPENEEARKGLENLTASSAPKMRSGDRVGRLQAWRRKVAGS